MGFHSAGDRGDSRRHGIRRPGTRPAPAPPFDGPGRPAPQNHKGERPCRNSKVRRPSRDLKDAFAGESQANRRYLYFAQKADVEGFNDVAAVFRSTAEGETGHAHGHLEYLEETGDPATGEPIGNTALNLKASIAGETHEYTDMYPGMARGAVGRLRRDRRLVRDAGQG